MMNVETKDFNLYFEIKDMSTDDEGNLFPAGIKVTIAKNVALDSYEKMVKAIKEMDEKNAHGGIEHGQTF